MILKTAALIALCATLCVANERPQFGGTFEPANRDYLSQFADSDSSNGGGSAAGGSAFGGAFGAFNENTTVDTVIDTILATGRQGRNLDGFDDVYSDANVQEAINKGDDRQARNVIRDKLCSLGLMDCDANEQVQGKRPFLPPGELIYSQPPPGYYQQNQKPQQQRPPNGAYGPARPMPPPNTSGNKYNGPPRKVGYAGPSYPGNNGPNYASRPPGSSLYVESKPPGPFYEGPNPPGPIYQGNGGQRPQHPQIFEGPKPPGPIFEDNSSPYKFDNTASVQVHEQHEKYETIEYPGAQKIVEHSPAAASNTVNIHHHYHHLDGTDATKTVAVNPISVTQGAASISSSHSNFNTLNGLSSSAEFSANGLTSGGFSPMSSGGYFDKNTGSSSGVYGGNSYKPIVEPSNSLIGVSGPGSYDGAVNSYGGAINVGSSYGVVDSGSQFQGSNQQFQGNTQQFGGQYGSSSVKQPSYHSQNPEYYKKALNTNAGGSSLNSLSSLSTYSKYNNQYANTGSQGGQQQFNTGENYYETARQDECVCVPFQQCTSQDVIGRKDDLILPLDPRNLKSDIEALEDEMAAGNKTVAAEQTKTSDKVKKDVDEKSAKATEKKDEKKVTKREATDKSLPLAEESLDQADGQARHLGLGGIGLGGYGAGGYGGGYGGVNPLGNKKVVPTFGVSFGLPYPTSGVNGYPINPFGGAPAVNQNFGSLSPNGLNLGLVNVNPLVSFQVAKNELGEKLFKPLVNLHVTPNANIIQKVGDLWKSKKFGFGGPTVNEHYHTHTHYPNPPEIYHPHHDHHEHHPHHYEEHGPSHLHYEHHEEHYQGGHYPSSGPGGYPSGPSGGYPSGPSGYPSGPGGYPSGPSGYPGGHGGYGFPSGPQGYYRDASASGNGYEQQSDPNQFQQSNGEYNEYPNSDYYNTGRSYSTNGTATFPNNQISNQNQFQPSPNYQDIFPQNQQLQTNGGPDAYADYASYNQQPNTQSQTNQPPQQQPQQASGSGQSVAFPNSRRKRSTSDSEEATEDATVEGRISNAGSSSVEKRQAYYQQQQQRPQQQCAANQVCCRRPQRQPHQQAQVSNPGQCGRRNTNGITGRIKTPVYVDGDSEFGEYPWQVAILKKDPKESVYICGGTLIDNLHILTAAHCVKTYTQHDLRVRLGEWDVNHDVEFFPYIERDVVSVTVHPEYYAGTLDNDLAIIRLNTPVDFASSPHISPACLPDKYSDYTGARCWTTGWGKDAFGDFGKYQNILKEVDVPIIGQQQCEQQLRSTRLGYSYKLNPGFICAGGEEGKDACKGDGGGPMVCERNGSWQLVGVVSWGIGCGQVNVPGVYVRVSHYLDWIQANTRRY